MNVVTTILAAGQGKRMRSRAAKVLHPIGGKPMLRHVLELALQFSSVKPVVVIGHQGAQIREAFKNEAVDWVEQSEQRGTGHAVLQASSHFAADDLVVILYGDVPLLRPESIRQLIEAAADDGLAILSCRVQNPTGYGRVLRSESGKVRGIVEHRDASPSELGINEINTGIMVCSGQRLHKWLPALGTDNAQGEYYLTDCVALAVAEGLPVGSVCLEDPQEAQGVNDRRQLASMEREFQMRCALALLDGGVTLADPARLDVRGSLDCGDDVTVDVNVVFEGNVRLGDNVYIGPNCVIRASEIGDGVTVLPHSLIDSALIGEGCQIGPFARIRPGTVLEKNVHVGNFVEVKNSQVGAGSKANHLSYLGDATVGKHVNIGAGTITCNYDGARKHRTIIEDDVFVGSDTQLVAPVRVGHGVTIAAGTTVTEDVDSNRLVISRVRQKTISGWSRPRKENK